VRSFGLFLGRGFQSLEAQAGDVKVSCIFAPDSRDCARLLLDTAVDVINFYKERFGFYPTQDLVIVPGIDRPAGGYPVATNMVAIHGMARMQEMPTLHWQWITAHEIGHQYFGEYVLEKDSPGWLWIGLGLYADQQYTQARALGPDEHQELLARYCDGMRNGYDTTVARSEEQMEQIDFDFNSVVIHGKGFAIISALDCILGKSVFSRIVDRCLHEYAGIRLGECEFRAVCEAESGQDLGWFFDQWIHSNRYLSYEITDTECTQTDIGYCTQVTVKKLGTMDFPIPVQVTFTDGSTQTIFTDRLLPESIVTFVSAASMQHAVIDPEGKLAMIVPPL
jgi:aminopeptidase N